jgi:hypothetical protein
MVKSSDGKLIYPCGLIANSMFNGKLVWYWKGQYL